MTIPEIPHRTHDWHLMLMPEQSKMARALLRWTQQDLGNASKLGLNTIQRFESGNDVYVCTMEKIKYTLEDAGIKIFYDNDKAPGVTRR